MKKLIIENRSKISMKSALYFVGIMIGEGKISESAGKPQYCHHMQWEMFGGMEGLDEKDIVHVSAFRNAKSDRIVIHHNDGKDWQK